MQLEKNWMGPGSSLATELCIKKSSRYTNSMERIIASKLRLDKGTETGIITTIHGYLRKDNEDMKDMDHDTVCNETVIYGPSTSNKIERWWKDLHERLEKYFKLPLHDLLENGYYNPQDPTDRF
eukprot:Seg659.2 transcript_id=Seg659.2/GoldUCD/mRNA.D3Y31 product="hypothetical protein" protein_id=Seg659.2/GoldUCD/D3Y31